MIAMKPGQRVQLVEVTPKMIEDGLRPGMIGTVRKTPHGSLGVEFDGHSDTGWNAGLHVTVINTRRDGHTVPVISLCRPLN
jgi:hypothetical protein